MSRVQGGFYFLGAAFVFSGVVCIASTATHTQSTPSPIPSAHNSGMMTLEVSADMNSSGSSSSSSISNNHAACSAGETDALVARRDSHSHDLESLVDSRTFGPQVGRLSHNQSHNGSSSSNNHNHSHGHGLGHSESTGRIYKERDSIEGALSHRQQHSIQDMDADTDTAGAIGMDVDSRHRVDGLTLDPGGASGTISPSRPSAAGPHTPSIWDRLSSPFSSPFRAMHTTADVSAVAYRDADQEDEDCDDESGPEADDLDNRNSNSPPRGRDDATSRLLSSPTKK